MRLPIDVQRRISLINGTTRRLLVGFTAALLLASLAVLHADAARAADDLSWLDAYNVVWDTPSKDATGSMPLSGGNLGLNVWIEGDDLLFYIGSPDSRIEDQKLVKLGRVRLTLSPPPFRKNFRMELDLAESCIRITGEGAALKLWIDAFQPVVHVEMQTAKPVMASVAYESWRFTAKPVTDGLQWCYRLDPAKSDRPGKIKAQRVEAIAGQVPDPLKNLTLGGRLVCPELVADGTGEGTYMRTPFKSWKAKTAKPVTKLDLRVLLRVAQDDSVETWRSELDKLQRAPTDRHKTIAWWRAFWNRSFIDINPAAKSGDTGWQVGRNYQLFRYMLAANRAGTAPTLFNGGFFTFDNPLPNANAYNAAGPNPDERAWWDCLFMAQNQRLVYWPMLKSGDFDLLDVGLDFYRDRAALQEARSRHFFGVDGTPFCESLDIYGLQAACPSDNGHMGCEHLTYHYTSALELAFMMLEECRFRGHDVAKSLPVMMGMLKFYDNFYQQACQRLTGKPLDATGRLVIYPGNACEMGVGCRNHADAVAGLRAITDGLRKLPGTDRAWLASFAKRIPEIPTAEKSGHRYIALADSWKSIANPNEFPQLYTLFPFHIYGVGLPDLELARDTWRYGAFDPQTQKESLCWKYGNTAVADLGLADEAKSYCLKKFLYPFGKDGRTVHYGNCAAFTARFPAFWVTYPFDAFPDMDHGGCAMIGLQEMLLQTPGNRLLVLPAWPVAWDVHFRLHAPQNTTVECQLRGGKIGKLEVTPAWRKADVEIFGPAPPPPVCLSQGKPATASSTFYQAGYEPACAVDGDPATRWASAYEAREGWLQVDLGKEKLIGRAFISEIEWPETREFAIEYKADDRWVEVAHGTTIGVAKTLEFPPVRARYVRLHVFKAERPININEFQLFTK
jgi:hypothetical protein